MKRKGHVALFCSAVVISILGGGCSDDLLEQGPDPKSEIAVEPESRAEQMMRSAVLDESTGAWITPQEDPYALKNFQQASENLAQGRSALALTRAEAIPAAVQRELATASELQATHLALKVWPRTEDERDALEFDEDLDVIYEPFDYQRLPEEWTPQLQMTRAANTLPDERKYTVIYTDYEDTAGNPVDSVTVTLPVLYVVWPVDKPIPDELDHEVLYEAYLPHKLPATRSTGISAEASNTLEREAVFLATRATVIPTVSGTIQRQDTRLWTAEPMAQLRVQVRSGTSIWESYTGYLGNYQLNGAFPLTATLNFVYQYENYWKIVRQGTSDDSPIVENRGLLVDLINNDTDYDYSVVLTDNGTVIDDPRYEIHRATAFFYHGAVDQTYTGSYSRIVRHPFPRFTYSVPFKLVARTEEMSDWDGRFLATKRERCYIEMSNTLRYDHSVLMGVVFHELGHWTHYGIESDYNKFRETSDWIKESWAPYVGWYAGELFYEAMGWTKIYPYNPNSLYYEGSITGQAEQHWNNTMSREKYSPRFVDLVDDYNQRAQGSNFPNDAIKNVPYSVLEKLIKTNKWSSYKSTLDDYIGVYFTREEFDNYCEFWN